MSRDTGAFDDRHYNFFGDMFKILVKKNMRFLSRQELRTPNTNLLYPVFPWMEAALFVAF